MAPASGVSANLPMRNSGTDTGEEGARKSASLVGPLHARSIAYECISVWHNRSKRE